MMLDVDHFKAVNDALGHLRGDDLLRDIAGQLNIVSRPGDLSSRYAGDEFVLLLAGINRDRAEQVLERVREAVDLLSPVDGVVQISASLGIACYPQDGLDGRALLEVADHRMYMDKFRRRELPISGDETSERAAKALVLAAR
jgi:diguanylate cyclase (GGDEF)-like protein